MENADDVWKLKYLRKDLVLNIIQWLVFIKEVTSERLQSDWNISS